MKFERLTYRYGKNNENADFITINPPDGYARYRASFEGAKQLATYEDSELSPEQVQEIAKAEQEKQSADYVIEAIGSEAKHIIDLLGAEAKGRLVVLPCSKGDTLYFPIVHLGINDKKEPCIHECEVSSIFAEEQKVCTYYPGTERKAFRFEFAEFGRAVFLTREEAKKALEIGGGEE